MIVATTFFNHPHIKGEIEFREKGSKVVIKGMLKYCLANGMKDMEVDDEMVKDAKDFDRKIQTVFN